MKKFILESKNVQKDSFIWNMTGSMLMAFQSVILLMILTRTVGLTEAGIFTIAYANANLFLNIGKYGMRYFQVSDVKGQFTFSEYLYSRWISTAAMIIVSITYLPYTAISNQYTFEKSMVILWMCIFKAVDAVEDVYYGEYQKKGRLDIASKSMSLRLIFTIAVFAFATIVLRNQLIALIIATFFTSGLLYIFLNWTKPLVEKEKQKKSWKNIKTLLKTCFPLFAGAFLSFYIGNAPKYAIDSLLNDELQACYGFIAMPVFVIGLLNNFVFNPILYKMSCLWSEKKIKKFLGRTMIQVGIVGIITVVCIIGAYLIGVPVLSVMYDTDLSPYKTELLILLLGGGFLGLSGLLNAVITIIRFQKYLLLGYGIIAVIAFFCSDYMVRQAGMFGAAILYAALMAALCLIFIILFIIGIIKNK